MMQPTSAASPKQLCRRFSVAEIWSATQNLSETQVIGKGGFGVVYKGLIDNESVTVAVKRLSSDSKQGKKEFAAEMETLTKFRHRNLVSLIGYCNEHEEMILVYEYMANGTLAEAVAQLEFGLKQQEAKSKLPAPAPGPAITKELLHNIGDGASQYPAWREDEMASVDDEAQKMMIDAISSIVMPSLPIGKTSNWDKLKIALFNTKKLKN